MTIFPLDEPPTTLCFAFSHLIRKSELQVIFFQTFKKLLMSSIVTFFLVFPSFQNSQGSYNSNNLILKNQESLSLRECSHEIVFLCNSTVAIHTPISHHRTTTDKISPCERAFYTKTRTS